MKDALPKSTPPVSASTSVPPWKRAFSWVAKFPSWISASWTRLLPFLAAVMWALFRAKRTQRKTNPLQARWQQRQTAETSRPSAAIEVKATEVVTRKVVADRLDDVGDDGVIEP